ncbi:MAG TPA: rod shape-determining protein RodA [Kofleriaceae bacterium]|nr:rod shape-determining protein RodA [Kofleriaceae bacterium]
MRLSEKSIALSRASIGSSRVRRFLFRFDWPLFLTVAALAAVGLLNLYSATARTPHYAKFENQIIWITAGVISYVVLTAIDYRTLHRMAWFGLVATLVLIVGVHLLSDPIKGSQRWLEIGALNLQPSEIAKIAVILGMARLFHDRSMGEMKSWAELAPPLIGIGLPVVLVAIQPDLGTSILLCLIIASVCFLLAVNLVPPLIGVVVAVCMVPIFWDRLLGYQQDRVLAFLDPSADPTGAGWHTQQSIFAVGSGRLTGKGFLDATQNHFNFLPEHWTDFPFSVWAEEWGFIGSVALILVFGFLILWTVNVALQARDRFGTAICLGVAAMLFWHVVVNIAMVIGLAPVVGVTLPFISYGGSSTITFFVGLGLVSSVSMRRSGY